MSLTDVGRNVATGTGKPRGLQSPEHLDFPGVEGRARQSAWSGYAGRVLRGHLLGGPPRKDAKLGGGKQGGSMSSEDQKLGPTCLRSGLPTPRCPLGLREGENMELGRGAPTQGMHESFLKSRPKGTTPSL